ncbi:carboxymuconolactone decarboxylase family protein [Planctomycetota bacterium]
MANEAQQFYEKFKVDMGKMQEQIPDTMNDFFSMFSGIMKDGAISVKEKELIALGIAVAQPCVPCIRLHVQKSLAAGATKEQILEAASVAVMMAGGPGLTHIPMVIDALEALSS